jgi:hypothetical protein
LELNLWHVIANNDGCNHYQKGYKMSKIDKQSLKREKIKSIQG